MGTYEFISGNSYEQDLMTIRVLSILFRLYMTLSRGVQLVTENNISYQQMQCNYLKSSTCESKIYNQIVDFKQKIPMDSQDETLIDMIEERNTCQG